MSDKLTARLRRLGLVCDKLPEEERISTCAAFEAEGCTRVAMYYVEGYFLCTKCAKAFLVGNHSKPNTGG